MYHFLDRIHLLVIAGTHHHVLLSAGIASPSLKDGRAAARILIDPCRHLLPLFCHDQGHLALINPIHNPVHNDCHQISHDNAIDKSVDFPEHQQASHNDCHHIQRKGKRTQTKMWINLLYRHRNKILASGG